MSSYTDIRGQCQLHGLQWYSANGLRALEEVASSGPDSNIPGFQNYKTRSNPQCYTKLEISRHKSINSPPNESPHLLSLSTLPRWRSPIPQDVPHNVLVLARLSICNLLLRLLRPVFKTRLPTQTAERKQTRKSREGTE